MDTFKIEFRTDGESFGNFPRDEIADILRRIHDEVYSNRASGVIKDGLGNEIGTWRAPEKWPEQLRKANAKA